MKPLAHANGPSPHCNGALGVSAKYSDSNVVNLPTSCAGENDAPPSVERAIQIGRCRSVGELRNVT